MGAYSPGGIRLLSSITKPRIGIVTGLNEQHMSTFGSKENIIKTKFELVSSLPGTGTAVLNGLDSSVRKEALKMKEFNPSLKRVMVSGLSADDDAWAENIKIKKDSLSFSAFLKNGEKADFNLPLMGGHNVSNLLLAILCSNSLGMSLKEISRACEKIEPCQSGMQLNLFNGLNIIDATYSSNPNGVISHLEYLRTWPGKKVIVMPCLIELGSSAREVHSVIGKEIGKTCESAVITTLDYFREIKKSAVAAGIREENIFYSEDPELISRKLGEFSGKEDVILLESRVPKKILELLRKKQ
jgi:UDP-N-acetylmuramoyl-tripeptide--D-alanyl-D-alanine ligase